MAPRAAKQIVTEAAGPPFESLDFVYMPTRDVVGDMAWFTDVLGGRLVFAVEGMGARVAMIELSTDGPPVLLADHVEGDSAILVYRVADLKASLKQLAGRGWKREGTFEIPHGPICSFHAPGGQRIAVYQLTRPEVGAHFNGRRDF
jgi:hypothetical protein